MLWLISTLVLLLEAAAVVSAGHALFTVRTAKGAIAWILGLLAFPLLAVPLYWFFGSRRFDTHARIMREKFDRFAETIRDIRDGLAPYEVEADRIKPSSAVTLSRLAQRPFLGGNRLDLLIDGPATFDAILGELARAERSIYVQFYILREDALGRRLLEALAARAACGVEICFLYDSLGSNGLHEDSLRRWRDRGVVGFDLAGPEAGFPPSRHAATLARVRAAGVPITLHAGEADVAERVIEAADHGAVRIGHGVHLSQALADPARRHLVDEVRARGLHLEVCPTSNVHTGAYPSLAAHPITALWRAGVECSFNTDNRLMSMVGLAQEAANLVRECSLTMDDLLRMTLAAAERSFLPAAARAQARGQILDWAGAQGLTPA